MNLFRHFLSERAMRAHLVIQTTDTLVVVAVSDNITRLPLPPRSPELSPLENIWQFMRDNWLLNRAFTSYEDILEHCC